MLADILSCCPDCGYGCDGSGGHSIMAWSYWITHGVVTGGLFNTTNNCMPYAVQPCEHYNMTGPRPACTDDIPTPKCVPQCQAGYPKSYEQDKVFGARYYDVGPNVTDIMTEIYNNGPITAIFEIYADFLSYKSGVYQRTTDNDVGNHVVKVIGWGVENNTDYWLVANEWNTDWGDRGFFKIIRGTNECGIESKMHAGVAK